MKNKNNVPVRCFSLIALSLLAGAFTVRAQTQTPAPKNPTQDAPAVQTAQAQNLQAQLNLTPEQIQKWRALNRELREQWQAGTQRLIEARRALADSMESPSPNEDLIKQRAKELADAQSTMTQLEALRQARVLQILTPEQRVKAREIRERNQAAIRERNQALRRGGNQQLPRNGLGRRQDGLPRNANSTAPLGPRQRKLMRPQPKP